jgi:ribosomal protein S18 acetylase RimI-like enzyme
MAMMMNERGPVTVYYLQMLDPSELRPKAGPAGFGVERVSPADGGVNRRYYERVGGAWNWTDRLVWSDEDWRRYAQRDELETWIGRVDGEAVGYFELERQAAGDVELAYFGLLPAFIGRGLGGALLTAAAERAWSLPGSRRVWLHTCTDDHANALENYRKRGFAVYETRQV